MKRIMILLVSMLLAAFLAASAMASPLQTVTPDSNSTWIEAPVIIGTAQTVNAPEVAAHNLIAPKTVAVYVRGYRRANGTYVQPHYRTRPDGIKSNNRSYNGW